MHQGSFFHQGTDHFLGKLVRRLAELLEESITRNADADCSGDIAGAQLGGNTGCVHRAAGENHSIDQGQAERPAKVAHQVEQPAAIGNKRGGKSAKRHPGRRQEAEHDRRAAQNLRYHHIGGVSVRSLPRAQCHPDGEQREPRQGKHSRPDTAFEKNCDRSRD